MGKLAAAAAALSFVPYLAIRRHLIRLQVGECELKGADPLVESLDLGLAAMDVLASRRREAEVGEDGFAWASSAHGDEMRGAVRRPVLRRLDFVSDMVPGLAALERYGSLAGEEELERLNLGK